VGEAEVEQAVKESIEEVRREKPKPTMRTGVRRWLPFPESEGAKKIIFLFSELGVLCVFARVIFPGNSKQHIFQLGLATI
jgi:hypothetical protein